MNSDTFMSQNVRTGGTVMAVRLIVDIVKIWCSVTTWMGRVQTDVNPDIHKRIVHNVKQRFRIASLLFLN